MEVLTIRKRVTFRLVRNTNNEGDGDGGGDCDSHGDGMVMLL